MVSSHLTLEYVKKNDTYNQSQIIKQCLLYDTYKTHRYILSFYNSDQTSQNKIKDIQILVVDLCICFPLKHC